MSGKRFAIWMALSLVVSVTGCCNWCRRHCCQPAAPAPAYPVTYAAPAQAAPVYYQQAPACCPAAAPAPACCPATAAPACCPASSAPVCCPATSGYQPMYQPAANNWSRNYVVAQPACSCQ